MAQSRTDTLQNEAAERLAANMEISRNRRPCEYFQPYKGSASNPFIELYCKMCHWTENPHDEEAEAD